MNDDELELAKAAAEGTAAGLLKSVHDSVLKLGGPPAEELGEAWRDWLKVWRLKRTVRLQKRVDEILAEAGGPKRAVSLKLLVPAMEAASLEDDDTLQDMWARLLATSALREVSRSARFMSVLKELTPDDARFLVWLRGENPEALPVDGPFPKPINRSIFILDGYDKWLKQHEFRDIDVPIDYIQELMAHLARLGVIRLVQFRSADTVAYGSDRWQDTYWTEFGRTLVDLCGEPYMPSHHTATET